MWERYKDNMVIRQMVRERLPMTRNIYIDLSYPFDGQPKPWTAEHEDEIPEPLQDWSKVGKPYGR
jgi:hypothetical protein